MRPYLHARRLSILSSRSRHPFSTTSPSHNRPTATDLPTKNKALLDFLSSTKNSPPLPRHIRDIYAPQPPSQTSLPQSPLTDPALSHARLRHKHKTKERPNRQSLSKFQIRLRENPYALALASPVRQCGLTGARLPAEFLLPFGLATHPRTGRQWQLPRMVAGGGGRRIVGKEEGGEKGGRKGSREEGGDLESGEISTSSAPGNDEPLQKGREEEPCRRTPPQPVGPRALSSTYFLNSARVLRNVSGKKRKEYLMLLPHRWREDPGVNTKEVVWREDMEGFLLGFMRRRMGRDLADLARKPIGCVVPCNGWDDVGRKAQVVAVLWFGGREGVGTTEKGKSVVGDVYESGEDAVEEGLDETGEEDVEKAGEETGEEVGDEAAIPDEPPPYAMVKYNGHYTPVYNLQKLLGKDQVRTLQEDHPDRYGGGLTVIETGKATMQVQQDLWQLMGYLSIEGQWAQ